ncbi:TetR/AcrR family transcriptional regulator [Methylocapsa acidiphila]|uniref:TetR/AcrR family transcriptional regulator n=1 Tax=Methylocapsa acidiphila TaxID=133552 RepID=UPI0003FFB178|nr:TetR/AcrR family transcriptional regulator [Methylocapsa acidiphila]
MSPQWNVEATRLAVLDQGLALIMRNGYHGTGLSDILAAAKVPKGSFYHYFASKEDFGVQVIAHYIDPFIKQLNCCIDAPEHDALTALKSYFLSQIEDLQSKNFEGGCLLGNLMGEIGDTSEAARAALKEAVDRYRDALEAGLDRAQREGSVRLDKTARSLADLLIDAWQGALLRMKIEHSARPLQRFLDEILLDYCAS